MFVGKINSINFHNQRVSSFQGDTLNNNKSEKTEKRVISTKLLLGVLGASAAVMGTAYLLGSRAGRKHLVKNARRTVEEVNKLPDVPVAAPNPQKLSCMTNSLSIALLNKSFINPSRLFLNLYQKEFYPRIFPRCS